MRSRIAALTVLFALLGALVLAAPAAAGPKEKGSNGKGRSAAVVGHCAVDGTMVHADGLPVMELMNMWVTEADGSQWGWVLGKSDDGTWSEPVPARSGETTYEFISVQWGKDGKKYDVYASCTAN